MPIPACEARGSAPLVRVARGIAAEPPATAKRLRVMERIARRELPRSGGEAARPKNYLKYGHYLLNNY